MKTTTIAFILSLSLSLAAQAVTVDYDTERGFRHPGMLHTSGDFERVRQQLEEGNETVTQAYNTLCNAEYAQSTAASYPVETIIRGGGGELHQRRTRGDHSLPERPSLAHLGRGSIRKARRGGADGVG